MTTSEINAMNRQTADMLFAVSQLYSLDISESVVNHYGNLRAVSRWEQETMDDDLISKKCPIENEGSFSSSVFSTKIAQKHLFALVKTEI